MDFRWEPVYPLIHEEVTFRVKAPRPLRELLFYFLWFFEEPYGWWEWEGGLYKEKVDHSWWTSSVWVPTQAYEVILMVTDWCGRSWQVSHKVRVLSHLPYLCSPEHVTLDYLDSIRGITRKEAEMLMEELPIRSWRELARLLPEDMDQLKERVRPCYSPILPKWPFSE